MLKKLLIVGVALFALLLGFIVFISLQKSEFAISRSAKMNAPPAAVFAQVNDFHNWDAWSPWAKIDPQAKAIFEGPGSGTGAIFKWSSESNEVGAGSMKITDSQPDKKIDIELSFTRPFVATNQVVFFFEPVGEQTNVTWHMSGKNDFMGKLFATFVDCDKMIGDQFEKGLASMKQIVETKKDESKEEKSPAADAPAEEKK